MNPGLGVEGPGLRVPKPRVESLRLRALGDGF